VFWLSFVTVKLKINQFVRMSKIKQLNSDELAQKISDLNADLSLCNGDVGTIGMDQDELVLRPYLAINGKTKKERRAQKRENNRIEARNKKASRKLNKNILATQEDIINYLK
jgi:hypothetical protein